MSDHHSGVPADRGRHRLDGDGSDDSRKGESGFRVAGARLALGVERWIGGSGRPLVALHGFTGCAQNWAGLAVALSGARDLYALDLPGHGTSDAPSDPSAYTAERTIAEILAVCDRIGLGRFDLLGYSLGGRVAMRVAVTAPERIGRLILESASPGIVDEHARAARAAGDEALAHLLETAGIAAFVDRWERVPIFASQARLPADLRARHRAQRLANCVQGLAGSLRGIGAGVPEPLHGRLGELTMPIQLIVGGLDTKYVGVGREMARLLPDAHLEIVPGAGHAVHLERPDRYAEIVRRFLDAGPDTARRPLPDAAGAGDDGAPAAAGDSRRGGVPSGPARQIDAAGTP